MIGSESVTENASASYPRTLQLGDLDVTFRLMGAADRDHILGFTRSLPERALLFLRVDITRQDVVDLWLENIAAGQTVTVLAEEGGEIIGYSSLHRSEILWARHLGEVRLLVNPNFRGKGVGGQLARQLFALARSNDLLKLVANMMSTQRDAQSLFHHLGFIPEAMLHDWAIDRDGRTHDLIIMSREVEED